MADCEACPHHSGLEEKCGAACREVDLLANISAELVKDVALLKAKVDEKQIQSDLRFSTNREAIGVAKAEMERRLEGMNEFRAQLESQAKTFIARPELKLEVERIISRILLLEKAVNYREGSKHWSDHIVTVLIAAGVMIAAHYLWK